MYNTAHVGIIGGCYAAKDHIYTMPLTVIMLVGLRQHWTGGGGEEESGSSHCNTTFQGSRQCGGMLGRGGTREDEQR